MACKYTTVYANDAEIADWLFRTFKLYPVQYNLVVGVQCNGVLSGAFMFTGYNGNEAELHGFGVGCLKRHIWRETFIIASKVFQLGRLLVRTNNPAVARGVLKFGAIHEGCQRRVYGTTDDDVNKADCFVFFREQIDKLARII